MRGKTQDPVLPPSASTGRPRISAHPRPPDCLYHPVAISLRVSWADPLIVTRLPFLHHTSSVPRALPLSPRVPPLSLPPHSLLRAPPRARLPSPKDLTHTVRRLVDVVPARQQQLGILCRDSGSLLERFSRPDERFPAAELQFSTKRVIVSELVAARSNETPRICTPAPCPPTHRLWSPLRQPLPPTARCPPPPPLAAPPARAALIPAAPNTRPTRHAPSTSAMSHRQAPEYLGLILPPTMPSRPAASLRV